MNIKPGQVLPINYKLWPSGSDKIVQAMIVQQNEGFYQMCPVHVNIESAGFFDLIVRGSSIESKMDLVIMCNDTAWFPEIALNTEEEDEEYDLGPVLTDQEGQSVLADMQTILSHQSGKEAYAVLRGSPLPTDCDEKILAETLRREWQAFRISAMCQAVKARQEDLPGYLYISGVLQWAQRLADSFFNQTHEESATGFGSPVLATGANVKQNSTENENEKIKALRQTLQKDLSSQGEDKPRVKKLLSNDNAADLLEAVLRVYPEREI